MKFSRLMILGAVLGLFLLIACFSSVTTITAGHRGVKTVWGKVTGEPLTEGLYFTSPFSTSIYQMNIQSRPLSEKSVAYTKDVQTANISYVVTYSLDGTKAGELFETVGIDFAEKIIPQAVLGSLKNAVGQFEAVEIISHRQTVRQEIQKELADLLKPRGIIVEDFQMTDLQFTKEFDNAVEAKVVAIQKADQARNETVSVQERAKQVVITANADAQAMKIKSDALSQNQNLVAYEAVKKWDGALPHYMTGGAPLPFLNVTQK